MIPSNAFTPVRLLRNAHVQTILASTRFRTWGKNPMLDVARKKIIQTPEGVRLLGFYSRRNRQQTKGLVIMLHGWEGSVDSTYMQRTGRMLYNQGFDVFRLNFRDHGNSHHLNKGIFYAVLLNEVMQAVKIVSQFAESLPVFLVGFSLGGNFVLRILRSAADAPINNLCHAVCISPVLDPQKSTRSADKNPIIRKYFLKKWRRSLKIKQQLYPDLYDFSGILTLNSIQEVTDALLDRYSNFESSTDYFRAYSVLNGALQNLTVPTTLITAADDPIIPIQDFYRLKVNGQMNLVIQPYGGHNGFIDGLYLQSWYESVIAQLFDQIVMK